MTAYAAADAAYADAARDKAQSQMCDIIRSLIQFPGI